jgi:hypothetical protein
VVYHSSHTATLLADGRVLIAGGFTPLNGTPVAELYDPATNSWTAAAPLSTPRIAHSAVRLPDGEALVIGGAPDEKNTGLATAERYDPRTDQWRTAGAMHTTRVGFTTTLLPDGKVLVAGGETVGGGVGTPLAVAELYDPATNAWMTTTPLPTPRSGQRAVLLMDGRVLLISDEVSEVLPRGQARVEQYFERSRLEYHPENAAPYNILLGQLGRHLHAPDPPAAPIAGQTYVPETGHNVAADFCQYWQANGGLAQFGHPISEEMPEQLADGQTYTVQYFERARFERHPENPPPWAIGLGQLGRGALAAERH